MYSLYITDIAEEDILSTAEHIATILKSPVAANDLLDEIEKHESPLGRTPNMSSCVPDEYLRTKGIKYIMVKEYMMFYTVDEDKKTVTVLRFLYGDKDWKDWRKILEISTIKED
ncbi:MAG: type II toxin-antitoxin system RelE/ParE family toxin [Spirochaetales bacterium]|jgi:plasmid stabilization system protein ParE|nr:type II toxin-antitoxin system RelE/ParE family toxin [Spirochaetales bacterium]